ncbi:MAG: hypothetical protein WCE63_08850 [Acidobacteriaceae bacterium]
MKIEISEIIGATDRDEVLNILEAELRAVADHVVRSGDQISVGRIKAASFGHINRTDSTFVSRSNGHQVLLAARLDYRPSLNLWCWLFVLVFTSFGWVIPLLVYFYQMHATQAAIEQAVRSVILECEFRLQNHARNC